MTEREFLDQQAYQARRAMSRTLKVFGKNLGHSVDPRIWTKSHPWLSLTGAAAAGFAAVSFIPRSPKPSPPPAKPEVKSEEEPEKRSFFAGLLVHAAKLASKWVASMVVSNVVSKMSQEDSEEGQPEPAGEPSVSSTQS